MSARESGTPMLCVLYGGLLAARGACLLGARPTVSDDQRVLPCMRSDDLDRASGDFPAPRYSLHSHGPGIQRASWCERRLGLMARPDASDRVPRPPVVQLYKLIASGLAIGAVMIIVGFLLGGRGVFLWLCGFLVLAITLISGSAAIARYKRGKDCVGRARRSSNRPGGPAGGLASWWSCYPAWVV